MNPVFWHLKKDLTTSICVQWESSPSLSVAKCKLLERRRENSTVLEFLSTKASHSFFPDC